MELLGVNTEDGSPIKYVIGVAHSPIDVFDTEYYGALSHIEILCGLLVEVIA